MLSHWIFFVSLFLLPYSTHGFNITGDAGDDCPEPITEGNRTLHCFELRLGEEIQPPDNRLMPTKIVLAVRNNEGQITERIYPSNDIAPSFREMVKKRKQTRQIRFFIDFPGGLNESKKIVESCNEFILYFGSDHAQMYADPDYGYNADFLQLRREKKITFSSKVVYDINGIDSKIRSWSASYFPPHTIFTPGIYTMKMSSGSQVTEVTYDPITNYDHLNYHGNFCQQPFSGMSKFEGEEMTMTTYCFYLDLLNGILPKDNRLFPTAIAFLVVDNNGKIDERYKNNDISSWVREKNEIHRELNRNIFDYTFQMQFPGNVEESNSTLERITDFILYFGSDHAQIYDKPQIPFDPENLQLSEKPTDDLSGNVEYTIYHLYYWNYRKVSQFNCKISKPGIYRIRRGKEGATEMHYDPMVTRFTHMHLK